MSANTDQLNLIGVTKTEDFSQKVLSAQLDSTVINQRFGVAYEKVKEAAPDVPLYSTSFLPFSSLAAKAVFSKPLGREEVGNRVFIVDVDYLPLPYLCVVVIDKDRRAIAASCSHRGLCEHITRAIFAELELFATPEWASALQKITSEEVKIGLFQNFLLFGLPESRYGLGEFTAPRDVVNKIINDLYAKAYRERLSYKAIRGTRK